MGKMQRTNLAWDKYIDYLIDAINGSKFMKRAENKPMSTPKTATESHISTRSIHLRESADVAKRLAKGLELNEDYIYAAMLMHDAGHPFSAHEGEEIFNYMGELYDTQYFHHNAKGVEIILSEDICGKAISKIPNIDNNPKLRQQLEDEFDYFLDVIISHDGEANKTEMTKPRTYYPTIKDALNAKLRLANTQNSYKFIAQTPEGRLAKFADVIAYLSSDMQDGFRLGILKGFSDDYLELFGEMFSTDYPGNSREEKIECGRRIIEQMKKQNLREKRETRDFMLRQDPEVQKILTTILSRVMQQGFPVKEEDVVAIQQIVEEEQADFRKKKTQDFFKTKGANIPQEQRDGLEELIEKKSEEGISLDEMEESYAEVLNTVQSQSNKIEEFVTKMLRTRSSVVYEVTSKMKEYFINDLIRNSKNSTTLQFSPAAWELYRNAKNLNYKEFVKSTNWDYQTKEFPVAALELVEECAESLVKSGAIRNKFYDEDVREHVTDEEAKKYMKTKYRSEESYVSYRKEHGIGDLKAIAKPSSARFEGNKQYALMKLYQELYSYVQNEDKVFAIRYENTFNAIKTRVTQKINNALTVGYQSENSLYKEKSQAQIDAIRQEILQSYGALDLTSEQKEQFISKKIEEQLGQIEQKMAIQLASDYVAGMTDRSFADIAIKTGHLSPEVLANGVRGAIESENVNKLIQDLKDDTAGKQTKPEALSSAGEER